MLCVIDQLMMVPYTCTPVHAWHICICQNSVVRALASLSPRMQDAFYVINHAELSVVSSTSQVSQMMHALVPNA